MVSDVKRHLPEIKKILQQHFVKQAYLFGSAANENMHEKSDVDFLIQFRAGLDYEAYANNYFDLMYNLQNLLNKDVDLIDEETLSNPYLIESINMNKLAVL